MWNGKVEEYLETSCGKKTQKFYYEGKGKILNIGIVTSVVFELIGVLPFETAKTAELIYYACTQCAWQLSLSFCLWSPLYWMKLGKFIHVGFVCDFLIERWNSYIWKVYSNKRNTTFSAFFPIRYFWTVIFENMPLFLSCSA